MLPGTVIPIGRSGNARLESWWTLEAVAKPYDGNDNSSGVVMFDEDVAQLRMFLDRLAPRLRCVNCGSEQH
jgi:hypothetical protein